MFVLKITMIKISFFFATISSYNFVFGILYSTCYEYGTYCLFSFGPNVTVNNVKEAQKICEDAKHGSWLLEIDDYRTLKNVKEFVAKYSYPNDATLILNAEKVRNKWKWIKSLNEFLNMAQFMNDIDGIILYKPKKTGKNKMKREGFIIICMTGCYSNTTEYESTKFASGNYKFLKTKDECLEICERSLCAAWSWETDKHSFGCWIHDSKGPTLKNPTSTLYLLNRSAKTKDKCIGNTAESALDELNNAGESEDNKSILSSMVLKLYSNGLIVLFIVLPFLIISTALVVAVIIWRKRIKRIRVDGQKSGKSPNSIISQRGKPSNYVDVYQPNINDLNYADLCFNSSKENKTPKKYVGPLGDVYTGVLR